MNTKETIIDVAYKEFLIKGYKGTSLNSIAEKVNITKPALYYHFSNKKNLFIEVFSIYFNRLSNATYKRVKTSSNAKDALRDLLYHYHDNKLKYELTHRLYLQ